MNKIVFIICSLFILVSCSDKKETSINDREYRTEVRRQAWLDSKQCLTGEDIFIGWPRTSGKYKVLRIDCYRGDTGVVSYKYKCTTKRPIKCSLMHVDM